MTDLGTCTGRWRDGARCTEPAAHAGTLGCVHEHVSAVAHCTSHREGVEAGHIACWACWDNPARHTCIATVRYTEGATR